MVAAQGSAGNGMVGRNNGRATNDFWDTETLVGDVSKNARGEVIRVKRVTKRGRAYVDLRTFYPGDDGELRPGKGISIPDSLVDAVIQLLRQAAQASPVSAATTTANGQLASPPAGE